MLRRIVSLALVALLTLALTAPVSAAGPVFSGGVFLTVYPFPIPVYEQPTYVPAPDYGESTAGGPPVEPEVCYVGGCYHLRGDGVSIQYQWIWVPNPPAVPPAPPTS